MRFTVSDLLSVTAGELLSGDASCIVESLSIDSREIGERCLFVPIKGENSDGHDYIEKALSLGAVATLTSEVEAFEYYEDNHEDNEKCFILVNDTVAALQAIGKAAGRQHKMKAVGITGSVGKTTTREMIHLALSAGYQTFVTEKNYNNRLGVPITLSRIPDDAECAVLELGMNVPGELGTIASLTDLSAAVITNIGDAHMEYYGSREGILKEKLTITRGFAYGDADKKLLFLNADDPILMRAAAEVPYHVVTFGVHEDADYRAENVHSENANYVFDLICGGEKKCEVRLAALGEHNVLNAVCAMAVADRFGVSLPAAARALSTFTGFKGRLEKKEHDGILLIDDTYNASPLSMKAGLKVLSELSYGDGTGRKIAVLGDMLELGATSDELHYNVGVAVSDLPVTDYFFIGEKAALIKNALSDHGTLGYLHPETTKEAVVQALKDTILPGDIVYIKASRGLELNRIAEELIGNG